MAEGGCDVEWTDEHNLAPRVRLVEDENHVWLRVEGRESAMGRLSTRIKVKNAKIDIYLYIWKTRLSKVYVWETLGSLCWGKAGVVGVSDMWENENNFIGAWCSNVEYS